MLIPVITINTSTFAGGIRHHENWRIIVGGFSLAIIVAAEIVKLINGKKQEKEQVI